MNRDGRRRFAAAAAAIATYAAYAACAPTTTAPETAAPWHDQPLNNHPTTDDTADSYTIDVPRPPQARASRGTARTTTTTTPRAVEGKGDVRTVTSTAYCLTGTMANGQRVHPGVVAMNGVPLGSVWHVEGGGTYTVTDRVGHGSGFDIWMGSCDDARRYGRRTIVIRREA